MKKILVVDNDRIIREFLKDILLNAGHEVIVADSGLSALDRLQTFTPDIIFTDLLMPQIDGVHLCSVIRR